MSTSTTTLDPLAAHLHVSSASLARLGVSRNGTSWLIPERNADGEIIGMAKRFDDGAKGFVAGGKRGLTMPWPPDAYAGSTATNPLLLVEGMSDAAAGLDLGFTCIGRPGARNGIKELKEVAKGRHVVVVGENDGQGADDPNRPGKLGAEFIAQELVKVAASVRIIYPPPGAKDLREWFMSPAGCDRAEVESAILAAEPLVAPVAATPSPSPDGRDPVTGRLLVDPKHTPPIARAFAVTRPGLIRHGEVFLEHAGTCYHEVEDAAIRRDVYRFLEDSTTLAKVNQNVVGSVADAISAHVHVPASVTAPAWLTPPPDFTQPAGEFIACKSKLLHLPTMEFLEPRRNFFVQNSLTFDPLLDAPEPTRWLAFTRDIFGDDAEQIGTLQELFGYYLSGDTSQQKIGLIIGPRRSGKGTIARVKRKLIGEPNVAAPTTAGLAGPFGLQALIGKSLAIIADARFSGEGVAAAIERLLTISGEDAITIDRKHRDPVTMKLGVRFLILSNELPRLHDSSAAIASRFLILKLDKSFYGREDPNLTDKLLEELPGIFNWAIEGWRRLRARGRFIQPVAGSEAQQQIEDLSSPVGAFIRERCVVGPGHRAWCEDLYASWRTWCESEGRDAVGTKQSFGRDLAAAVPGLTRRKGTGLVPFYAGIAIRGELLPHTNAVVPIVITRAREEEKEEERKNQEDAIGTNATVCGSAPSPAAWSDGSPVTSPGDFTDGCSEHPELEATP